MNTLQIDKNIEDEKTFSTILDIAHDAIITIDQNQNIVQYNQGAKRIFGYDDAEVIGQPLDILLPISVKKIHREHVRRFAESASQSRLMGERRELSGRRKDGSIFPAEASITKVSNNGQKMFTVILNDITERKHIEKTLRTSEGRYRALAEASQDNITIVGKHGKIEYVNQTAARKFNRQSDEFVGSSLSDWFPQEIADRQIANIDSVYANGKPLYVEAPVEFAHSIVWMGTWLVPLYYDTSEVVSVMIVSRDITERVQFEKQLQDERDFAQLVMNTMGQGLAVTDGEGIFEFVNPTFANMVGVNPDELIGSSPQDVTALENLELLEEQLALRKAGASSTYESRLKRIDGHTVPVMITAVPRDTQDSKNGAIAAITDLTDYKAAEESLRKSEERFRTVVATMEEGLVMQNASGEIILANPAAERLLGLSIDQMAGRTSLDPDWRAINEDGSPFPGEMHPAMVTLQTGEPQKDVIMGVYKPEGALTWISINSQPLFHPDQTSPYAVVATFHDITEAKLAEQKLQENERFTRSVVNSLSAQVVVLDKDGVILSVNEAWQQFAGENDANTETILPIGTNYIAVLEKSIQDGDETAREALDGILAVLSGSKPHFALEYPCHSPTEKRWYLMGVNPLARRRGGVVISHENITKRKLAEDKIETQLQRLESLHTIDLAIANSFDFRLTLKVLVEAAVSQLGVDAAAVLLFKPASNMLEYAAGHGFRSNLARKGSLRIGEGFSGRAALERKMVHIPNFANVGDQFVRTSLVEAEKFVSYYSVPLLAKGELKGVLDIFHRAPLTPDEDWLNFLETLAGQAAIAIDSAQTFEGLQRSNINLSLAYDATIEGWSRAMDLRDKETEGHTQRVTDLTVKLAQAMGMSEEQIVHIRRGALLHDMGKLGIPDSILLKPGKLTEEEWAIMRQHPQFAYDMLSSIEYLLPALDIPYCHHEKWDGTGYPRGLKGEQIPIAARLFAVVDVWDALRSDRPYRPSWPEEKVFEHIRSIAGTHLDPQVVELFFQVVKDEI